MSLKIDHILTAASRRAAVLPLSVFATVLVSAFRCDAQNTDLPYSSGSTGADGPLTIPATASSRYAHAMAYDSTRQRTVLFGGLANGTHANDTWEWNGTTWEEKLPGSAPGRRFSSALAYDAARQQVVLFGGLQPDGNSNGETWVWNGTTWQRKTLSVNPPARHAHALAYDSVRQRVVLFGGYVGGSFVNDTWEWDGTNWSQKSPSTTPQVRSEHGMAYDAARQRVVLFGGLVNGSYGNDTWEWNGTNWLQKSPGTVPGVRDNHTLVYDSDRQLIVLFGGYNSTIGERDDTWEWDGTNWIQRFPTTAPSARYAHGAVYDAARQRVVMFGGYRNGGVSSSTYEWDGTNWAFKAGDNFTFDMTSRANGIWNFTSIFVPSGVTVTFRKNATNTPVTWLATEEVQIRGIIDLRGGNASGTNVPELVGRGGPGGFDGGLGGTRFDSSGAYFGLPGQGPGGGAGGTSAGQQGSDATHRTTYGNPYLQPLIGGSGGGGGASSDSNNGGSGGGGAGAILIASSRDIVVTGEIKAEGGTPSVSASYGGYGSGGAVRLVADRLLGNGFVRVGNSGRIRFEGFYRELAAANHSVVPAGAPPTETFAPAAQGQLIVSAIAGQGVPQPPTGSLLSPDVVFTQAGPITVTVTATNIPDGTPVSLRISTSNGIITLPPVGSPAANLTAGSVQFTATVPAGLGSIQASAKYTVP